MYNDSKSFSAGPVQSAANALIKSMAEMNSLLDQGPSAHREAMNVHALIQSGYNIHIDFYEFMSNVSSQCEKSCKILGNIMSILKIAEEQEKFNNTKLSDIKSFLQTLVRTVSEGNAYNRAIQFKIVTHKERVEAEQKNLNNVRKGKSFRAMMKGVTGGGAAGLALTVVLATGATLGTGGTLLLGVAGGSAIAGGVAQLKNRKKTKNTKKFIAYLDILMFYMTSLQCRSDEFTEATAQLITDLEEFVELSNKNVKYSEKATGSRVRIQARKMYEETEKLQLCFKQIQYQASENAGNLRRSINF